MARGGGEVRKDLKHGTTEELLAQLLATLQELLEVAIEARDRLPAPEPISPAEK